MSKAVIGQFYKTAKQALKRAEELKRIWKGMVRKLHQL